MLAKWKKNRLRGLMPAEVVKFKFNVKAGSSKAELQWREAAE